MKPCTEIAMCHGLAKLKPNDNLNLNTPDIEVVIAVLEEGIDTPRNFNLSSHATPKNSVGGCYAHIFASKFGEGTQANLFTQYGPDIKYGDLHEYRHAVRALERIDKRLAAIQRERGNTLDAADALGRWLCATRITKVFLRPEGSRRDGWLNEGEWQLLAIGAFIDRVRPCLYNNQPQEAVA